jgi:hypothetical protein
MLRLGFAVALLAVVGTASAQVSSSVASREIAALFSALGDSGCEFNRNGTWHDAAKATAHLKRKYEYLVRKQAVESTELFIARAASKSSMSGEPYRVRCPGESVIDSAEWFRSQLLRYRKTQVR